MWKKISKYYPPWLEFIPMLLVFSIFFYTFYYYGKLPEVIPTHFNAAGTPDSWGPKGTIIILPVLSFGIYAMDFLIKYFLIIKPEDPSKVVNLSEKRKALLGKERLEKIRTIAVRSMWAIDTLVAMLFLFIIDTTIKTALGEQVAFSMGIWLIVGLLLGITLFLIIRLWTLSKVPD